jgi:uncharacterized protein
MAKSSSVSQPDRSHSPSLSRPILVCLGLFLAVIALRSIDLFALRLDDLPDPLIVSRVLGIILVLGYLWMIREPISSLGLHAKSINKAFLIGGLPLIILYSIIYAVQLFRLNAAGESPQLVFGAINQEIGVMGGTYFTLFYLVGQFFNAFMEEIIFRGLMLPHFMRRFSFWKANILQAFLFGLAHLVFPLSSWVRGQATSGEALGEAATLLVFTTFGGLIFGYLYYRTGNLWTAVFAHLIDNVVGLFFHIQTGSRLNAETDVIILGSIGFIVMAVTAWAVAKRSNLPPLKPWGADKVLSP